MIPVVVVDASAVVALLTDGGEVGDWVGDQLAGRALAAPSLLHYEVANVIRRQEAANRIDATAAALAFRDLAALPVEPWPFEQLSTRAWELRHSVTFYDAAYVALAEQLHAAVVTLDTSLTKAHGPACEFLMFKQ